MILQEAKKQFKKNNQNIFNSLKKLAIYAPFFRISLGDLSF